MTLTFPAIDRARSILWLVTGAGKAAALERLRAGDRSIPAGRVLRSTAPSFSPTLRPGAPGNRYGAVSSVGPYGADIAPPQVKPEPAVQA